MKEDLPRYDVVLVTHERPVAVPRALAALFAQRPAPRRVIVVDSSADPAATPAACREFAHRVTWLRSAPGTSLQRNVGMRHVRSPIVFFSDDDSEWRPGAAAAILRVYAADRGRTIAGVCAAEMADDGAHTHYRRESLPRWLRRLLPLRRFAEAHLAPDPFRILGRELAVKAAPASGLRSVEWMAGFRATARRDYARSALFDESLGRYALFEDVDFSFRLTAHGAVVVAPGAFVVHRRYPGPRLPAFDTGARAILHRAYIVGRHAAAGSAAQSAMRTFVISKIVQYALAAFTRSGRARCAGALRARSEFERVMASGGDRNVLDSALERLGIASADPATTDPECSASPSARVRSEASRHERRPSALRELQLTASRAFDSKTRRDRGWPDRQ